MPLGAGGGKAAVELGGFLRSDNTADDDWPMSIAGYAKI